MNGLASLLATWFGTGYLKPAPGTWGTLGALPIGVILLYFGLPVLAIALLVLLPIAYWSIFVTEQQGGVHDDPRIVIDEAAGIWTALLFCQFETLHILAAFVLFRFFDILKPWPVSWADKKIANAFGTLLDDVIAGIMAGVVIIAGRYFGIL